jgi:hypothetical protein
MTTVTKLTDAQHIAICEMQDLQDKVQAIYEQAGFDKPFSKWLQSCANAQRYEEEGVYDDHNVA